MNFYEQKHQNRIDFASAWFSSSLKVEETSDYSENVANR